MAAIFDLRHTQTSDSIPTSLSVLSNPKNMGIADGIRCYHVYKLRYFMYECGYVYSRFDHRHLEFLSDIWRVLPLTKISLSSPNKKPNI